MSSTALAPVTKTLSTNSLPTLTLTPKKNDKTTAPKPSTPQQSTQTGQWIHPRMDEVLRRRNATNFDSNNMKTILGCSVLILASLFVPNVLWHTIPTSWLYAVQPYPIYAIWVLRAFFALTIGIALLPLIRRPDACEDIPLTPQQRKLLGLPPMSRPATPQEKDQYVTPPRFSRSNTPRSSPASIQATAGNSPLSGRGTPLDPNQTFRLSGSGSPYAASPSQTQTAGFRRTESGSPLSGPASGLRSGGERRRLSYTGQRSSPLSLSDFDASFGGVGLSTPSKEKKASVGLNNKWLYEKGRGSPRLSGGFNSSLFS